MTDRLLDKDAIVDIATRLHRGNDFVTGTTASGFVQTTRDATYVGIAITGTGTEYITARLTTGTETIGRNDAKLKTQRNEYVKGELKHLSFETPPTDADRIEHHFKQAGRIDTGYINGWRVTPLRDVVDETFAFYSTDP